MTRGPTKCDNVDCVRCKKNKGYNRSSLMWMQSNGK